MKTIRKVELSWKRVLISKEEEEVYTKADSPKEAVNILRALLEDCVEENMMVLLLNTKNRVIGFHNVAKGGINACSLFPREMFRAACISGAVKIIIAHNHPSGKCDPSPEDIEITKKVLEAGKILGIELIDSIIIGDGCYFSFLNSDFLIKENEVK